ncbi:MAG: hypothetical protein ACKOD3_11830 [Phenylobacterium sp.]
MRYREIVEADAAAEVWKQTERTADALRTLRSKQAKVADAKASARALPAWQEWSRRLLAADRNDADARRVYGDPLNRADDRAREAMAKRR